jgi:hypothetical protein
LIVAALKCQEMSAFWGNMKISTNNQINQLINNRFMENNCCSIFVKRWEITPKNAEGDPKSKVKLFKAAKKFFNRQNIISFKCCLV